MSQVGTKKGTQKTEVKNFTSEFIVDAVLGGFEVKSIDGDLRCNFHQSKDSVYTKTEIRFNPKTNRIVSMIKSPGKPTKSLEGVVNDWNSLEGDFSEKIQTILEGSIKRQELLDKLSGLSEDELNKLIEKK